MTTTSTNVTRVAPGAIVESTHPVTKAPEKRKVLRISNHPDGVTVWYVSGPPDHLSRTDVIPVIT